MIETFTRGSTVRISATFTDADGNPAVPSGAIAYLSYRTQGGARTTAPLAMSQNAGVFTAEWDSRVAQAGTIAVHVRTTGAAPFYSEDSSFKLAANSANPI